MSLREDWNSLVMKLRFVHLLGLKERPCTFCPGVSPDLTSMREISLKHSISKLCLRFGDHFRLVADRLRKVGKVLKEHDIQLGLEFLGSYGNRRVSRNIGQG